MADHTIAAELFYDGVWNDHVGQVRDVDAIHLTAGSPQEGQESPPCTAALVFDNRDGSKNPRNPTSPLYGRAGRNTLLRVTADGSVRSVTETASWKPGRAIKGDRWTGVEGGGLLRRLQQGSTPLRSPAYRAFTSPVNDAVRVAYWPFEEESGATAVFSPYPGGSVTLGGSGSIEFGALESPTSARLARFGNLDTFLTFTLPTWTDTLGQHLVGSLVRWPEAGLNNNLILWRFYFTGGDIDYVDLLHTTGDVLQLQAYAAGTVIDTVAGADWTNFLVDRESFLFCTFEQDGADVNVRIRATTATSWLVQSSGTVTGRTLGRMYQMVMNTGSGIGWEPWSFGHVIVGNNKDGFGNFIDDLDTDADHLVTGARGFDLETAGDRFERLCAEEGVNGVVVGDPADTQRMGPQPIDTLVNLLLECVRTDDGLMFEPRDELGVVMRTGRSRYNQDSVLDLDFLGSQIAPPAQVLDDQATHNDVTASRPGGSTARAMKSSGPLNVNSPAVDPDGVGRYEHQVDVNTATDTALLDHATWHLHKGTVDEPRYPQVTVDLDRAPALTSTVDAVEIGDRITIGNMPVDEAPDGADLLVVGVRETISAKRRLVTFVTTPASPYEAGLVGADDGSTDLRGQAVDTDNSTLAGGVDDNDTALSVASTGGVLWTTDADDWDAGLNGGGLHIVVGGEVMRVTNITGASSPQAFTVVRSVNGVVKAHDSGAPVHARYPAVVGL